jgi:hypothetical protein
MRLFTLEEANSLIPLIRPRLEELRSCFSDVRSFREFSRMASASSVGGGGVEGGSVYVKTLIEFGRITSEITDLGVQIKDPEKGLIDFPSMKGERVVLLCWMLGEDDSIDWWHEVDAGFAGRQRL